MGIKRSISSTDATDHAQNTDTGTNQTAFQINSGPKLKNDSGNLLITTASDAQIASFLTSQALFLYNCNINTLLNAAKVRPYSANADLVFQIRNNSYDFSFLNLAGTEVLRMLSDGDIEIMANASYGNGMRKKVATVQVTDAVETDIATISVAEGDFFHVRASCVGRKTDGSKFSSWSLIGKFYRNTAGDVTQFGDLTHIEEEASNEAAWNFTLAADTGNQTIDIRVTGENAVDFKTTYEYYRVT